MRGYIKQIIVAAIVAMMITSCGISKLDKQVEVGGITRLELKGLTGLLIGVEVRNDSKGDMTLSDGVAELYAGGKRVAKLVQVGVAESKAHSEGEVVAIWRMEEIDPLRMITYAPKIMERDFEGLTLNYEAKFSTRGVGRRISGENVELTKIISIFAQ